MTITGGTIGCSLDKPTPPKYELTMPLASSAIRQLILDNTEVVSPALLPELQLRLATNSTPLMTMPAEDVNATALGDPFWAFAWAGGQGVARYLLDTPRVAANRRVFDLATGSGIIALAAASTGATHVIANDIDPFCGVACELNAELNQVQVQFDGEDRIGSNFRDIDVLVAGDICYEEPLASTVLSWLKALAKQGVVVYVGDPGRASFNRDGLECVANYSVDYTSPWDDEDVRRAKVFRVLP